MGATTESNVSIWVLYRRWEGTGYLCWGESGTVDTNGEQDGDESCDGLHTDCDGVFGLVRLGEFTED